LRVIATSACPADHGGQLSLLTGLHARQHGYLKQTPDPVACQGWPLWMRHERYMLAGVGCIAGIREALQESVYVESPALAGAGQSGCDYLRSMQDKGYLAAIEQQRLQKLRAGPFQPDRLLLEADDDIDGFIATEACRAIARMPTDSHWATVVMFSGPGNDLPAPEAYESLISPQHLEDGFTIPDFCALDSLAELDYPRSMLQRLDPITLGRIRADYLGRVSLIDHGVGRMIKAVEQREDASRTWIVIASDRGQLLGEHGLVGHRSFLAGALEVPFIIVPPTPAPKSDPQECLVSTVDVAATIAALAGCDVSDDVAGRSVLPLFHDEPFRTGTGGACISEFGDRLMMETDRHRVIFNATTHRPIGLFDLINDPQESQNLVNSPVSQNIMDALRWRVGDALMSLRCMAN